MPAYALSQLMARAKRKQSTALVPVQQTEADIANKMLNCVDELEQEFLATEVNEAQFGTALADCVLNDEEAVIDLASQ